MHYRNSPELISIGNQWLQNDNVDGFVIAN